MYIHVYINLLLVSQHYSELTLKLLLTKIKLPIHGEEEEKAMVKKDGKGKEPMEEEEEDGKKDGGGGESVEERKEAVEERKEGRGGRRTGKMGRLRKWWMGGEGERWKDGGG